MNGNAELLNFIYQNSQMGVETIEQLIGIAKDDEFKLHLEAQFNEYREINYAAKTMLHKSGCDEKGISTLDKIKTYLMINIQTLTDQSTSHIAEMLIFGSTMGVLNAIKNIRKYKNAQSDILGLMEILQKFEEENIQQLKKFL